MVAVVFNIHPVRFAFFSGHAVLERSSFFSRTFGCVARKGAVGTLRRMFGSQPSSSGGAFEHSTSLNWAFFQGGVPSRWGEQVHGNPSIVLF